MSEPLRDPEHQPAMDTSVSELSNRAQKLIDDFGAPVEQIDPTQDNPNAREFHFSEEVIREAGFEAGVNIRVVDEPAYMLEGEMTDPRLAFWIERADHELESDRTVTLYLHADGSITPKAEEDVFPANAPLETAAPTDDELDDFMFDKLDEAEHDIFSQAECDRLIKLIKEERKIRGATA